MTKLSLPTNKTSLPNTVSNDVLKVDDPLSKKTNNQEQAIILLKFLLGSGIVSFLFVVGKSFTNMRSGNLTKLKHGPLDKKLPSSYPNPESSPIKELSEIKDNMNLLLKSIEKLKDKGDKINHYETQELKKQEDDLAKLQNNYNQLYKTSLPIIDKTLSAFTDNKVVEDGDLDFVIDNMSNASQLKWQLQKSDTNKDYIKAKQIRDDAESLFDKSNSKVSKLDYEIMHAQDVIDAMEDRGLENMFAPLFGEPKLYNNKKQQLDNYLSKHPVDNVKIQSALKDLFNKKEKEFKECANGDKEAEKNKVLLDAIDDLDKGIDLVDPNKVLQELYATERGATLFQEYIGNAEEDDLTEYSIMLYELYSAKKQRDTFQSQVDDRKAKIEQQKDFIKMKQVELDQAKLELAGHEKSYTNAQKGVKLVTDSISKSNQEILDKQSKVHDMVSNLRDRRRKLNTN